MDTETRGFMDVYLLIRRTEKKILERLILLGIMEDQLRGPRSPSVLHCHDVRVALGGALLGPLDAERDQCFVAAHLIKTTIKYAHETLVHLFDRC